MNVFLTGGSGFVGNAVLLALLRNGHHVHALVNRRKLNHSDPRIQFFTGELFDDSVLDSAMTGCDAVIHLVGIIIEKPAKGITFDRIHYQGTVKIVDAARRNGIRRYVQMSALGAAPDVESIYLRTKFKAEEYVRASGLDWTVIRPSLIYGPGGDFTKMEEAWARGKAFPFFFMPYFGGGLLGRATPRKVQPIFVGDVARAFVEAIDDGKKAGQVFELGGPEQMTWPQKHRAFAKIFAGKSRPTLAIPAWYAKAITHVVPASLLPFTRDQVLMSEQDNVCDLSRFVEAFGWTPQVLSEAVLRAVEGSGPA